MKAALDPMLDAEARLEYAVSTSGRGVHFMGDFCVVDDQVRKPSKSLHPSRQNSIPLCFTGSQQLVLFIECKHLRQESTFIQGGANAPHFIPQ